MAITRLWFFTLRPNVSASDPAFTRLWTDVLELCALYTPAPGPSSLPGHVAHLSQPCPKRPHHILFQSSTATSPTEGDEKAGEPETIFVLISTYPSFALLSQADAVHQRRHRPQLLEFVRHRATRQMDLEDTEVVPRLLSSPLRKSTGDGGGGGGGGGGGAHNGAAAAITVTISDHDPLRSEVAESISGRRSLVSPPDEEISGADVYVPPPPSEKTNRDGAGEKEDTFGAQRGECRKWVRISRRPGAGEEDGNIEVFRLKELLAR